MSDPAGSVRQGADEVGPAGTGLRAFTDWAAAVTHDDLPESVRLRLKQSVRDALGCALYCAQLPWARMVADAMAAQSGGGGPATIWGSGQRVDAISAAVANGTAIQSFELDDLHSGASVHGSSAMLPALLALAETRGGISGAELMSALAVGWEAAVRVNDCLGNILVRGWHPPTMMGTIAAATASGRLLGLSAEQLYHCVSLGVLNASGITVVQYGGLAKRWYAGRAAEIGVQSALLAERGFTAPLDALGHEFGGFLTTFAPGGEHDVEALTRGLGERFAADGISFKLHACCGMNQAVIDMLGELVHDSDFSAADLDRIDLRMTEHGYKHSGFPYVPGSAVTAQFSVEYCLAAYLLEGAVFVDQFREELLADPRILSLVDRMTTTSDPTLQTDDPRSKRAAALRVTLRDGRVLERQGMTARGHADLPASEEQLREKFDRLVAGVLDANRADTVSAATAALESMSDVARLVTLVVDPSSR